MRKRPRLESLTARQLAWGGAGVFLLSVAVTLVVLAASPRKAATPAAPEPAAAPARLGVQDFLLDVPEAPAQPGIILFRQRTPRWSEEQVERYWIPMQEAILGVLRRENDRRVDDLLREVP